jgi:hypothetical protein
LKRAFVRGLWGIHDNTRRYYKRRSKMDKDIKFLKKAKFNEPFVSYVFGNDNYDFLKSEGFDCVKVSDDPILWDMDTQQFRHKIDVFRAAMEDFDQIVFLDWDTVPIKKLPDDFWDKLAEKEKIQAILRMYHRRKATWRKEDKRKIPCASFVYINDKIVPKRLIELWEIYNRPWSEEIVMARYMEEISGGWKGIDDYWEKFEPDFFVLEEGFVYPQEKLNTKNWCFKHVNERTRSRITKSKNKPEWVRR